MRESREQEKAMRTAFLRGSQAADQHTVVRDVDGSRMAMQRCTIAEAK